eukprot:TRINITY_DN10448_c0_g1_i1.p1 TRINITY_DN10448_c0_g1~~TRINITY_DN10448_c0_g1_i1.p1  ORF type:complete len:190 (+),score=68.64 TRINITY_DN10448_c0_g1_i1:118-687(+)
MAKRKTAKKTKQKTKAPAKKKPQETPKDDGLSRKGKKREKRKALKKAKKALARGRADAVAESPPRVNESSEDTSTGVEKSMQPVKRRSKGLAKSGSPKAQEIATAASHPDASDEEDAGSGSDSEDGSEQVDPGDFPERLREFLKKKGKTHIGIIARSVPRPEGLQLGKFFAAHKDLFQVDPSNGKISAL